ncbi:hypothetical protein [Amycolatopsis sp. WQ 127309]|uniref:hypothetical protein n=1 Tax=Amycolatopsis sp. WQ 127309 TaxID=2932773 RepID=UPI001FF4EBED|nr:hypothetical protein [Amycolatopsis sp. WQ 127309]UOZ02717.1 hypothetical protein MUY22_28040 [Amycolatopsis sp. WQ 127309]
MRFTVTRQVEVDARLEFPDDVDAQAGALAQFALREPDLRAEVLDASAEAWPSAGAILRNGSDFSVQGERVPDLGCA